MVFRPEFDDPTYSEQIDSLRRSIEALEEAGDKHDLRVQTVESARSKLLIDSSLPEAA